MQSMDMLCLKWTIFVSMLSSALSHIICPYVAELKSVSFLTCIFSKTDYILYKRTDRETLASCYTSTDKGSCIINTDRDRLNGTIVNTTHSVLEIREVQKSDEGEWICENKETERTRCNLVLKKTPSCNITTDRDTNELYVGDEITMSVFIEEYYCTVLGIFKLHLGANTVDLSKADNVSRSTLNLTNSHFGPVRLSFTCGRSTEDVSCGGIKHFKKHPATTTYLPPTSCCTPLWYTRDTYRFSSSGKVWKRPFFPEYCQSWKGGTKTGSSGLNETRIAVIAVTIAAVALIVTFVISICFCVKFRGRSSKNLHAKKESCPYADVADSIITRPKGIGVDAEGYAEISDIKGSFSNQAFDKGSVETTDEFTLIPCRGYVSVDEYRKKGPQLCRSDRDKTTQVFTLEDVYSSFPGKQETHRCEC